MDSDVVFRGWSTC